MQDYYDSVTEQWQGDEVEQSERARMSAPELSWALREVLRAGADVDHELARRLEMRPLDYTAMGHLISAPSPIGPAELSRRIGISTGSTTELVDRLQHAGHLHRRRSAHDRRRVSLEPTDSAVSRILGELRPLFEAVDALAEELTPDQQDTVIRYLRIAARRMRHYATPSA